MKTRRFVYGFIRGSMALCLLLSVLPFASVEGRPNGKPHKLSLALRTAIAEGRTTRVIVQAVAGQSPSIANGIYRAGAKIDDVVDTVDTIAATVTPEHLSSLAADPNVVWVTEDRTLAVSGHLEATTGASLVRSSDSPKFDSSAPTIAIIDSGIDANHPEVRGKINPLRNYWAIKLVVGSAHKELL